MGALPRPDVAPGPRRELVDALHTLHHEAGWPSLRRLAADTGVSHTTVSKALSAPTLPSWGTVELLAEAMGGDVGHFHNLWLSASAPPEAPEPAGTRIAGRTEELAVVRRHLQGGSGLLLVTGEAGIGKTTLVAGAGSSVDTVVAVGRCLKLSSEVPLLPVVDALRGIHGMDDGTWMEEGLATCPSFVRASLARLVPELDPKAATAGLDDPWGVERLFSSVSGILRSLAAIRPVALHLEDGHWADRSTLDLLTHLTSRPAPVPLVVTWRSGDPDVSPRHSEWLSRVQWAAGVDTVNLSTLSLDETAQQLRMLRGSDLGSDAVELIHMRSKGLPLYTAQLAAAAPGVELPDRLMTLLDRRIGDLDGAAWRVARALGLAQRPMGPATLLAASGLDAEKADDALRTLSHRGLLRRTGDDAGLAHPLLGEAIERRLVPGEAQRVHAQLAEALTTSPDIEPGEIADHWQAAGRPDLEAPIRVESALRAGARFAHREELDAWQRTLTLWDSGHVPAGVELWDVLVRALDAAIEVGDVDAGRALAERSEALDLPDRPRALVTQRIGVCLLDDGSPERGLAALDEALALLEAEPPSLELLELLGERVNTFIQTGQYARAEATLRRALDVLKEHDDPGRRRRHLTGWAWVTMHTEGHDAALEIARRAREIELPEPDPMTDIMLAANTTDILLHAAAPAVQVEEAARDALRQADAWHLELSYAAVLLRCNVSWALLRAGDVAAAHDLLRPVTHSDPTANTATGHVMLAAAELREGHVEAALARCTLADSRVHARNANWAETVPWHAEVDLWARNTDAALHLLDEALDVTLTTQAALIAAPLLSMLARAHADRLDAVDATPAQRHLVTEDLDATLAGAIADPFGEGTFDVALPALSGWWDAELTRVAGTATVERWTTVAASWDRFSRPHDAAYCRWRGAQVALHEGRGTVAARLLRRASADAHQHVPLREAIAATTRGA